MGTDIAAGKPIHLDAETRRNVIKALRDSGMYIPMVKDAARDVDYQPVPHPKKPWWRKLF
jgi:hypothetical protein